ncbi:protein Star-like [Panulirus ornatus]|uniref:protein Star-like n=1 Tax=Panulirus ornatus TaxID=150431 RepID=UPI003A8A9ECD
MPYDLGYVYDEELTEGKYCPHMRVTYERQLVIIFLEDARTAVWDGMAGDDPRVVSLLRDVFLQPPSVLPYNLSQDPYYLVSSKGGSWHYIHGFLHLMFSGQRKGFFVEAGALDGQQLSNSLWLEQELGWNGLLIEPNVVSYRALLAKHRKAWASNTCLSWDHLSRRSVHVSLGVESGYMVPWWHVIGSSYQLGVTMNSNKYDSFINMADHSYSWTQCFPLSSYLLALNISTIDVLSLDTQGSEKEILYSFPWNSVTVRVVIVEMVQDSLEPDADFLTFMNARGFLLLSHQEDYILVQQRDPFLSRRLS